jgi:mono/diheme cytochrome c family protein
MIATAGSKEDQAMATGTARFGPRLGIAAAAAAAAALALPAAVFGQAETDGTLSIAPELQRPSTVVAHLPEMDATRGRILFATKGCVICHEVNGVGGRRGKAPALDAARMSVEPNPFEFAARMWRGAEDMIALQKEDLGYKLQIRADELADIFAFVHDEEEQKLFTLPGRTR